MKETVLCGGQRGRVRGEGCSGHIDRCGGTKGSFRALISSLNTNKADVWKEGRRCEADREREGFREDPSQSLIFRPQISLILRSNSFLNNS